ncbi:hypothetical protein DAI22_04g141100 [Oryza sativa Japonica Group]|jgi:hypothetical protein|nr:hypothetical protein DAI22_04g141100 [Oryza sativa Japonica Group]
MDHTHARTKRSNSRGGEADKGGDAEGTYLYQSRRDVAAAGDQRGRDRTFRLRPPRAREILHARAREHLRRPIDRTDPAAGDRRESAGRRGGARAGEMQGVVGKKLVEEGSKAGWGRGDDETREEEEEDSMERRELYIHGARGE